MSALIVTTRARDLQSLGAGGQPVTEYWAVLQQLLLQKLGPAHAALLAEPLTNAAQGETDWYAAADQPVRPVASLPPEAQAQARQALGQLVGDIHALAAAMAASSTQGERMLAGMLDLVTQVPDDSYIHVAGTQPVLVAWGHGRVGAASLRISLTGERPAAPRPMAILPPPAGPAAARRKLGPAFVASMAGALLLLAAALYLLGRDPLGWYAVAATSCAVDPDEMALRTRLDATAVTAIEELDTVEVLRQAR